MKARLVISVVTALLSAVVGVQLVTKAGDPAQALQEFERHLSAALQPQPLFTPATPTSASFKTYTVAAPDGRVLEIQFDRIPTEDDLERIFAHMQPGGRLVDPPQGLTGGLGKVTQTAPSWAELEPMWRSLTWNNQQVAKAKAMLHWSSKPTDLESYTWDKRSSLAAQPWQVEGKRKLLAKRILFASGGAVAGFLLTFIALALLVWSWRFLLARIRELSDAMRGK
jgi:hypothetical protein